MGVAVRGVRGGSEGRRGRVSKAAGQVVRHSTCERLDRAVSGGFPTTPRRCGLIDALHGSIDRLWQGKAAWAPQREVA